MGERFPSPDQRHGSQKDVTPAQTHIVTVKFRNSLAFGQGKEERNRLGRGGNQRG